MGVVGDDETDMSCEASLRPARVAHRSKRFRALLASGLAPYINRINLFWLPTSGMMRSDVYKNQATGRLSRYGFMLPARTVGIHYELCIGNPF
jgi:hypothetical protein